MPSSPPRGWTPLAPLADRPLAGAASRAIPETRGRKRSVPRSNAQREAIIVAAVRALPPEHPGLTVDVLAAEHVGMSRYQTSVIVLNLVDAGALVANPSRETTPKGGRPPTRYALCPTYRAALDAQEARDVALFGTAVRRVAGGGGR